MHKNLLARFMNPGRLWEHQVLALFNVTQEVSPSKVSLRSDSGMVDGCWRSSSLLPPHSEPICHWRYAVLGGANPPRGGKLHGKLCEAVQNVSNVSVPNLCLMRMILKLAEICSCKGWHSRSRQGKNVDGIWSEKALEMFRTIANSPNTLFSPWQGAGFVNLTVGGLNVAQSSTIALWIPLVIKLRNGKSPLHWGFKWKWSMIGIFHCHVWLPESESKLSAYSFALCRIQPTDVLKNSGTRFCYFLPGVHIIMRGKKPKFLAAPWKEKHPPNSCWPPGDLTGKRKKPFPLTENAPETHVYWIYSFCGPLLSVSHLKLAKKKTCQNG